jgi:hypothetical protein
VIGVTDAAMPALQLPNLALREVDSMRTPAAAVPSSPPLACPDCGGDMRILAFISAAEPVDAILTHLGLPTTPPPLSPARGPPQHDSPSTPIPVSTSTRRPSTT